MLALKFCKLQGKVVARSPDRAATRGHADNTMRRQLAGALAEAVTQNVGPFHQSPPPGTNPLAGLQFAVVLDKIKP